jgi:phosphocarrier protein HPr
MLRESIIIQNKLGLHTRAAAKLVAVAAQFESKIQFEKNNKLVDCKSIMSIILLGAHQGTQLDLLINGADELEARDAIIHLIDGKFEETE